MTDALLAPFARVPIFHGLQQVHLERIARIAERVVYQTGDVIVREDEIGDAAVLVVSGKAVVLDDDAPDQESIARESVPAGSLVGELSMLIDARNSLTIVAQSSVRAFRIPRAQLLRLMEADPSLADHFVAKIADRLQEMAEEMRRIDGMLSSSVASHQPRHEPGNPNFH